MSNQDHVDIAALREELEDLSGPEYWRSMQELAETEAFQDAVEHEFPEGIDEWEDSTGRRRFLRIMGASMAFAGVGLSGCSEVPHDEILPYVEQQPGIVPSRPNFFATSFLLGGYAQGVLVENHMGRPTKIEGNPDHPASRGSTNAFMQGSILDLYDPDRSENILYQGAISTWSSFVEALEAEQTRWETTQGSGLRVLTGTVTSPTLAHQLRTMLELYPGAQWHQWEPTTRDTERAGLRQALGRDAQAVYRFDEAQVVLSLDDDFLHGQPGSVRYARDFADARRVRENRTDMNRLYVAESSSTITGSMADHRLPIRPRRIEAVARATAQAMGLDAEGDVDLPPELAKWAEALAQDLEAHAGAALVVAGPTMPPDIHALAHRMNEALGAIDTTVEYIEPVEARPEDHRASLVRLVEDMAAGEVDTLFILGGNPSYTAPTDVPFDEALLEVPTSVHLSLGVDATSRNCVWHVPRQHYLERWSDARAFDGTASLIQPLIGPIVEVARSEHDLLSLINGTPGQSSYDLVRAYWEEQYTGEFFDEFWENALQTGIVPGTGLDADETFTRVRVGAIWLDELDTGPPPDPLRIEAAPEPEDADILATTPPAPDLPSAPLASVDDTDTVTVVFRPDPTIWDGRFANNGWMQELPKPLTKLVWDNAAIISPALAERFDLQSQDVVELQYEEDVVRAAVWILPGHPDGTVTTYLGYGRPWAGRVAEGAGFNAYDLRPSYAPWALSDVTLRPTGETYNLVSTQDHYSMEGRELVRNAPIERFREEPSIVHDGEPLALPSLYPDWEYPDRRWGMAIDTNVCIGCNACVVACQSENNIPVVGKEAVGNGREMHWLVVDRYFKGDIDAPNTYFQPRPCMHCEKAPCEVVCPVYATVHDHEGLNLMVYNRCIGTRYCSNNCPYKVRRFNFLEWDDWNADRSDLQHNPEVSVRSRGVMEKCTYCQQRINAARIISDREDRPIRDGEVMTACQQACPTNAIVFGDMNDETEVKRWKQEPHNYGLLAELGTQPRTTYLAHFDNPNAAVPDLFERGPEIDQEEEIEVEVGGEYDDPGG